MDGSSRAGWNGRLQRCRTVGWGLAIVVCASSVACGSPGADQGASAACDEAEARRVVQQLGDRLKQVPLSQPDSLAGREIRSAFSHLVTPELMAEWLADPSRAPGREVSSPWPDRIEIGALETAAGGDCLVEGEVAYVSSTEVSGDAAFRDAVSIRVARREDGWRIAAYRVEGHEGSPDAAADVLRRYYAAIAAGEYQSAYRLWGSDGAASGQSLEGFSAGFAQTEDVVVDVGEPGRIEGAAGSRFVEVPVVVRARTTGGERQRFAGIYTLRRSVVPGASPDQREWRIHSADLEATR